MNHPTATKADACCRRLAWSDLDLAPLRALIQMAKDEDLEGTGLAGGAPFPGDHSSSLLPQLQTARAAARARQPLVACGIKLVPEILAAYDPQLVFEPAVRDGDALAAGESLGALEGPVRSALAAERPLLNFLQKLSGVSTITRRFADALAGSPTRLLDTRKTTPGYRALEKYAVACGGGWNHRIGLFDRVMLKDNHLAAFGAEARTAAVAAVAESRNRHPDMLVEMEVDGLDQIDIALEAEVDVILLDNFSPAELAEALKRIGGRAVTEASGGITLETLPALKALGLDFVSTGALVHQSVWTDIGLDWEG